MFSVSRSLLSYVVSMFGNAFWRSKQKQRIQKNVLSEQTQNVARTSDESDDNMPLANLRAMTNNDIANDPDLQNDAT
jgi:hypothetical protein